MVPGNADGSLDGIALKPLTVAFHEPGFIATLQAENQQPFWFLMSDEQRQNADNPMGPANPQALNRYSYVQNNPLRWTDPSGHWTIEVNFGAAFFAAIGIRVNENIAADHQGNVTFYLTPGAMASTAAGSTSGWSVSVTNAPHVDDLKGWAVGIGGQSETIPFAVAAEGFLFNSNDTLYGGVTVGGLTNLSAEFTKLPFELHGFADYGIKISPTWNIPDLLTHSNSPNQRGSRRTTP